MKNKIFYFALCMAVTLTCHAKDYVLSSPNGKLNVQIKLNQSIQYAVSYNDIQVITPSNISMTLNDGKVLGEKPHLQKLTKSTADEKLVTVAYRKRNVTNHYNQISLSFKNGYSIDFRAYDFGMAYRFNISQKEKEVIIKNEQNEFNFADDYMAFYSYSNAKGTIERQFSNSFENIYNHTALSKIDAKKIVILPMMIELPHNLKACITEVNQFSYPGMLLQNFQSANSVQSIYAPYPKEMQQGGHNNLQMIVKSRENYIAKVAGTRSFPWRAIAISEKDQDMTNNDLVYCLADNCKLIDTSWIKPGKVAWDWWNDWNLSGVDFKAGINNETYKYYIDFASKYGIEYIILDEGWAVNGKADMMQVIPEIDLKSLVDYAATKNVGIILWGGYKAMDKDLDNICKHYAEMGIKGFKVDFMDRDDQIIVDFYNRVAVTAAKYKLMIDFHGAFKPSGLNKTYPNVINYEGVHGLEQMKWDTSATDQVTYDVTLPFIRQVAGPMDYTQGAMRNATQSNYFPCNSEPMSQGTRCHQLAEYIIFESPFSMLCDAPTEYEKEPVYAKFLTSIPTIWDETHVIEGKVSQYLITARRSGNTWYVGGLNNWDARSINVDLSFISNLQSYKVEMFSDGMNADRKASDYKHIKNLTIDNNKVQVKMYPGGGFVIKLSK